jgi:hypothetical protein
MAAIIAFGANSLQGSKYGITGTVNPEANQIVFVSLS